MEILNGEQISQILANRKLHELGPDDKSRLDASNRWWKGLSPQQKEAEIQLLLAISESSGSGGP